ncbi:MAG TPA: LamG-like jellyroll fold domain-containing protein [Candidatus Limnocylindrales bacterium]|nr:LamG-like jellyroll fold domain-containing protein [Candidatus Limnocylindrales bacterium]
MKTIFVGLSRRLRSLGFIAVVLLSISSIVCPVMADVCAPAPPGLVAWWRAEGNGLDDAGTNAGSLLNDTSFAPGQVGQAFIFNGIDQVVQIPDAPELNPINALTLEAWIYVEGYSGNDAVALFGKDNPYSSRQFVIGLANVLGKWVFRAHLGVASGFNYFNGTTPIQLHTWYHVAMTYDGSALKLYVNSALDGSLPVSGPVIVSKEPVLIGGSVPGPWDFNGRIDEASIYNRGLSAAEVQAIYSAATAGKCTTPAPPFIYSQPSNKTIFAGQNATFTVGASGTAPLSYQWSLDGNTITGGTAASLALTNVQASQAGSYSVLVTNALGSALSSNAVLTVNPPPPCAPPAAGLVSWWRAEGDASDFFGGNTGSILSGITFMPGKVGEAFKFDGNTGAIVVPPAPNLAVQSFTIEAWINPTDISLPRPILEYGDPGQYSYIQFWYSFGGGPGCLYGIVRDASLTDSAYVASVSGLIVPNQWTHVAFTFDPVAHVANLFVNGTNVATNTFSGLIQPKSNLSVNLGYRPVGSVDIWGGRRHVGGLDEVSIYAHALSTAEIQALYSADSVGKCMTATSPAIYSQPANQTATIGQSVMFTVGASGTQPLGYQWSFNGVNIAGATNNPLVLTSVQRSDAGIYAVLVTNGVGSIASSNATLTVNFPPASVLALGTSPQADGFLSVPIVLVANGNENALGFSLNFSPSLLTYADVQLGAGAVGDTLFVNTNQLPNGQLGMVISLPTGAAFAAGTQEVAKVSFTTAVLTTSTSAQLAFGDQPTARQLSDPQANPLPANFAGTSILIPAADFEGDVSPLPAGDKVLTVTDWVLIGRYAARLDYPTNASEYQRADCAPRSTLGDGAISVADWVQAGRYAAGLDPATRVGGPTNDVGPNIVKTTSGTKPIPKGSGRQVRVADVTVVQGQGGTVSIYLDAQGNENALGFSVAFDSTVLSYLSASLGADASGATLVTNTNQLGAGHAAFILEMPIGTSFTSGSKEIIKLNLGPIASTAGSYPVALTDQPVIRQVVDVTATPLMTGYINGSVTVSPPPSLIATRADQNISLSWPLWATNFTLQQADGPWSASSAWSNVPAALTITNNAATVTLPMTGATRYYRLQK